MSTTLLIRDVKIFDGEKVIPNGSVLVEDGRIKLISDGQLDEPDGCAAVFSKPKHTLIPGIIDGHIHAHGGDPTSLKQSIKFGVTTVCDMHNEPECLPAFRKQALDDLDSADFKTASQSATIKGGWPEAVFTKHDTTEQTMKMIAGWPDIQTKEDIDAWIKARVHDNADYVKLMHEDGAGLNVKPKIPSVEMQKEIIKAAHEHGFIAVAHALSQDATIQILHAGIDGLTHTFFDRPPTKEVIDAYKRNNAHCNPTLAAIGSLTEEGHADQEKYARDPRVSRHLTEDFKTSLCQCMAMANESARVEYAYQSVRELKAAGIDIILGSDSAKPARGTAYGVSAHHEMALLVNKCGFTPAEALRAGTSLVAKRLGLSDRGRIAEGFRADLVLVEGDPLENIDDALNLRGVWKKGELISTYKGLQ